MKRIFITLVATFVFLFSGCKIAHRGANWGMRFIENTFGISTKSDIEDEYALYEADQAKLQEEEAANAAMLKDLNAGAAGFDGAVGGVARESMGSYTPKGRLMKGDTLDWYLLPLGIRLNTQDAIGTNVGVAVALGIRKGDKVTLDEVQKRETVIYAPIGRYFATKTTKELDERTKVKLQLLSLVNKGILTKSAVKEVDYKFYTIK